MQYQNEIILTLTLIITYSSLLLFYRLLGKSGLYMWTVIATICANIEVMILIEAFGLEQTLGNIMFASTFLVTDILSELEGKESANKAVKIGITTSISFILISQSWMLYIPTMQDWSMPFIKELFSNTPRLMFVGMLVYSLVQMFDVWLYHAIWKKTEQMFKDKRKGLWLRNNLSTITSQLINTALFTFFAFVGLYNFDTMLTIFFSSFIIYVATSLLDTPVVYVARLLKDNDNNKKNTALKKRMKKFKQLSSN
ncbi:MAG: transporter [Candidatus Epulonipiscioides saccharophilum]|nr:MAG: transporter [Epulopiscium sp. AS2M-Bin001]